MSTGGWQDSESHARSREPAGLAVEALTRTADLERLGPEWSRLWRRAPTATPFQTPEWLIPWWRHTGEGELLTLALRAAPGGALLGLIPLCLCRRPHGAPRRLHLLGAATADGLDALAAPGWRDAVGAAAFAWLDAVRDRWDAAELAQMAPGALLLTAPAPAGWAEEVVASEPCPALDLPGSLDELTLRLPANMTRTLRASRRLAARAGEALVVDAGDVGLDRLLDAHLALRRPRPHDADEEGAPAQAPSIRALRESSAGLRALGLLRLYGLAIDGRLVATLYGLVDRSPAPRRFFFHHGHADPAYGQINPSTLLLGHAVEQAVREGARAFDFLRGRELYKYLWGATDRPTYRRRLRHGP